MNDTEEPYDTRKRDLAIIIILIIWLIVGLSFAIAGKLSGNNTLIVVGILLVTFEIIMFGVFSKSTMVMGMVNL